MSNANGAVPFIKASPARVFHHDAGRSPGVGEAGRGHQVVPHHPGVSRAFCLATLNDRYDGSTQLGGLFTSARFLHGRAHGTPAFYRFNGPVSCSVHSVVAGWSQPVFAATLQEPLPACLP